MASVPPEQSQTTQAQEPQDSNSASYPDSQTTASSAVPVDQPAVSSVPTTQDTSEDPPPPLQRKLTEGSIRRCWVCYGDETEDTATTSPWRRPCHCTLTAHEECLLGWEAGINNDNARRYRDNPKKVECPQCKTKIEVARPKAPSVELVRLIDRIAGKMVMPTLGFSALTMVYAGSMVHGIHVLHMVFGRDGFLRLAGLDDIGPLSTVSWKWAVGVPSIPWVLIMARTRITDPLLPALPLVFFGKHVLDGPPEIPDLWHPSAAMAFGALPFIRLAYNLAYRTLFEARLKAWNQSIQPRLTQQEDGQDGQNQAQERDRDHEQLQEGDLEINFQVEVVEEALPGEERQQPRPLPEQDQGENRAQNQGQQQENGNNQGHQNQDPPAGDRPFNHANNVVISATRAADSIVGALFFPAISTIAGELLRLGLPFRFTSVLAGKRPNLLQSRWGRTIVGGCLFVVLKDALFTYSRWKLTRIHKNRMIVDYQPQKR